VYADEDELPATDVVGSTGHDPGDEWTDLHPVAELGRHIIDLVEGRRG
jgi:hypothetical protein